MGKFAIGVIASLSGPKELIGRGVLSSVQYVFALQSNLRSETGDSIELIVEDDRGQVFDAIRCMERCLERDCVCVIGPGDSDSFQALVQDPRFQAVPLLATLATGSEITANAKGNVFRFTTPNIVRAELLLMQVQRLMPSAPIEIYTTLGAPETFAQSLRRDVVEMAKKLGLVYSEHEYSTGVIEVKKPARDAAIVICAASAHGIALLQDLRQKGCKNQAFGFGSNTNWLTRVAEGLIVVCDLDRNEANLKIRKHLDEFFAAHPNCKDPSLPSMNATFVLSQVVNSLGTELSGLSVSELRRRIMDELKGQTFDGLFGPVAFSKRGEMAGFEQIVISRVRAVRGGRTFSALRDRERAIQFNTVSWVGVVSAIIGAVGAITGLIGVIQWFLPR